MTEWRSMESAPRDGSHFIAWARLVYDEEDEDRYVIRKGAVEYYQVIVHYLDMFRCFVEFPFRNSIVSNQTFLKWHPSPANPEPPE